MSAREAELEEENLQLQDLLDEKTAELDTLQENLTAAIDSIKTFHDQQKQLYSEFVALHKKYEAQKSRNRATLWDFVPANCPGFDKLPLKTPDVHESEDYVDCYKLDKHIGHGQFGDVRRAVDLSQPVPDGETPHYRAVKIIDKYKIPDVTSLTRVVAELSALQILDHPNVLSLQDVIHSEDYLYIVTDYGGQDLFEFFEKNRHGVDEDQARNIIQKLVAGVSHVHAKDFCHRDLKPENILFDTEQNTLRVIDFGLCADLSKVWRRFTCLTASIATMANFTQRSLPFLCSRAQSKKLTDFCGSPGFFAPEIIVDNKYHGQIADYWSIGCILLELVAGNKFFEASWMPVGHSTLACSAR